MRIEYFRLNMGSYVASLDTSMKFDSKEDLQKYFTENLYIKKSIDIDFVEISKI